MDYDGWKDPGSDPSALGRSASVRGGGRRGRQDPSQKWIEINTVEKNVLRMCIKK